MAGLNGLRGFFYVILWLFAVVLLGLTAHRLKYTTRLPAGDPLNNGQSFYDPIIAELLATSALTIIWIPFIVHVLCGRADYGFYGTFFGESLGLFCLFVLYLVGAIIATHFWGDLAWCREYIQCRVLTVVVAFSWMCWIVVFTLFSIIVIYSIRHRSYHRPLNARYDSLGREYRNRY